VDRPIVHALRGLAYEACSPECLVKLSEKTQKIPKSGLTGN
jgi:hypothetical protein